MGVNQTTDLSGDFEPGEIEQYLGGKFAPTISKKIRKDPGAIGRLFKEGKYPYVGRISKSDYEREKARLPPERKAQLNSACSTSSADRPS